MVSEARTADTVGSPRRASVHPADDLIMQARRERALWLRAVTRGATAWLKSHAPAGLAALVARRRRAAEVRELLALDDRTLADIGVRREDLRGVVHGDVDFADLAGPRARRSEATVVPLRPKPEVEVPADLGQAA